MDKFIIALDIKTKEALEKAGLTFIKTINGGAFFVFENQPTLRFSDEGINALTTNHLTFD